MNKKIVGMLVALIVIVLLVGGVFIGKLALVKQNEDDNSNGVTIQQQSDTRTSQNSSQQQSNASSSTGNNQSNRENVEQQGSTAKQDKNSSEDLVKKVVENSKEVGNSNSVTEDSLILNPSDSELRDEVYELKGVVKNLELLTSNNEVQSQYKAELEVDLGGETVSLDYFTTSNSIEALKIGIDVTIKYQLTLDSNLVIRGVALLK